MNNGSERYLRNPLFYQPLHTFTMVTKASANTVETVLPQFLQF